MKQGRISMNISRRQYIKYGLALLAAYPLKQLLAADALINIKTKQNIGNFEYIYSDAKLRKTFLDFYRHVFNLYPEEELHALIYNLTKKSSNDSDIYQALQSSIDDIKPFMSDFRYALPALARQKEEMTRQTLLLLDNNKRYEGYLEIGTTGRYLSQLEDKLDIQGERFLLHTVEAGYSPLDIIDRGQLTKIGQFVEMGNYSTTFSKSIKNNSLDLVTVYIGFHHCPQTIRSEFINAVRDVIKPGGKLILRDHNAYNEPQRRIAALAHDTFNAGTNESWGKNKNELRNFYSLKFITDYLIKSGFAHNGKVLYQKGDPTLNGLMAFTKV